MANRILREKLTLYQHRSSRSRSSSPSLAWSFSSVLISRILKFKLTGERVLIMKVLRIGKDLDRDQEGQGEDGGDLEGGQTGQH